MIQNGYLTYNAQQNPLLFWRPSNPTLYSFLAAALATILSYQAAALILDLCMGIKRSGRTRVSDIAITLLVRSFSPVAVLHSLFPSLRDLPTEEDKAAKNVHHKSSEALRFPVVAKLAFLLTIVPVINVATVIFNLESTTWLTVKDAKFGGISFGVNPNLSIQPALRSSNNCTSAIFVKDEGEDDMAKFLNCETLFSEDRSSISWVIGVAVLPGNVLLTAVDSPAHHMASTRRAFVLVRGLGLEDPDDERNGILTTYQLRAQVSNRSAEMLVDYGLQMVKEICRDRSDAGEFRNFTLPYSFEQHKGRAYAQKRTNCLVTDPSDPKTGGAAKIVEELSKRITFIDSPRFEISAAGDSTDTFISAQDLLLLRRRRSYVSLPILGIITSVIMVLRLFIGFVTSNDVERGIGLIIRQALGLRCCDSMLPSPHVMANYKDEREVRRLRSDVSCDD